MKNFELLKKLYVELGINFENEEELKEKIHNDEKHDYLTENEGRDGKSYYHYYDGEFEGAIEIESQEIITDSDKLEKLFY